MCEISKHASNKMQVVLGHSNTIIVLQSNSHVPSVLWSVKI